MNYRGGFISYLVEVWLKEDMIKNLKVLQKTGLLFNVFGVDWSYLFVQEEHGDITIVPNAGVSDYWHILDNVTDKKEFLRKVRAMERATWRHFAQIQARTRLQHALRNLGESIIQASESAEPDVRERVLQRCGTVHANAFRLRGPRPPPCDSDGQPKDSQRL